MCIVQDLSQIIAIIEEKTETLVSIMLNFCDTPNIDTFSVKNIEMIFLELENLNF